MEFTRFRSKGKLTAIESGYWLRYWPNTCPGSWGPSTESVGSRSDARFGRLQTIADTVIPGYYKAIQKGDWLGVNYLSITDRKVQISGAGGVVVHHPTVKPCGTNVDYERTEATGKVMPVLMKSINNSYSSVRTLDGGRCESVVTEVITRCMSKRLAGQANVIETLAEMDQTWAMVNSPLSTMGRFCEEFSKSQTYRRLEQLRKKYPGRRMNSRVIQRGTKASAQLKEQFELHKLWTSEYLRYRYGISPLVSDVQAALKTLKTVYDKNAQPTLHTARAGAKLFDSRVVTWDLSPASQTSHNVSRADDHQFSVKAYWHDLYAATALNEMGLTFHNAVAVPWELTRLSFVLDWFVNVGDLIYANIPRVGVSPKGGGYTIREEINNSYRHAGYTTRAPAVEYVTGSWGDQLLISHIEKTRRGINRDKHVGLVIKDDFRLTHWTRATDLVAIVFQQLSRVSF